MISLAITPNIERTPWTDLDDTLLVNGMCQIERIGRLPRGTKSGKSTVSVIIVAPDGRQFVAQTTMELFKAAARTLIAVEEEEEL